MNKNVYALGLAVLCAAGIAQASEVKRPSAPANGIRYYQQVLYAGAFVYNPVRKDKATYVGIKMPSGKEVFLPFCPRYCR